MSQPGVAPKAGWYEFALVVCVMTEVQVAPVPPPPVIVHFGTPVYPLPAVVNVTALTTFMVVLIVAVHFACVPPAQIVVPVGEVYFDLLLGTVMVQVGALV